MRVLLVQRTLDPPGGDNAVAAWMLQALLERHEPATLTEEPWDPARVNAFYGTSIEGGRVEQLQPAAPWRQLARFDNRLERLRMAVLQRAASRLAPRFDLLVTADTYAAFNRPGLQYVHSPSLLRPESDRWRPAGDVYYRLCDRLAGVPLEQARSNRTLVNSAWTARELERRLGLAADVLYPPVADPGPGQAWEQRANTFLCVGRFHLSKRFELAVAIIARLRELMPDARLHVVGFPEDADYAARVRRWAEPYRDWVTIEEDLPRARLLDLMGRCKYGIQAMDFEHFGMAPAEMVAAGVLVFVHDSGGPVEIVDGAPALRWTGLEDAVHKIHTVARDQALQQTLRARLAAHAAKFSTGRFKRDFLAVVDELTRGEAAALP